MTTTFDIERPNWAMIYPNASRTGDGELIQVTRESLRLAAGAIRRSQAQDAYHNFAAAEVEIEAALEASVMTTTTKPAPSADAVVERLMDNIRDVVAEAEVDYPAGREAGARVDFDENAIRAFIRSAFKAVTSAAEPCAWLAEGPGWKRVFLNKEVAERLAAEGGTFTPLYASPQPAREADVALISALDEMLAAFAEGVIWTDEQRSAYETVAALRARCQP